MTEKLKYSISVDGVKRSKAEMNDFSNGVLNVNNAFIKTAISLGSVTAGIAVLKKSFDAFIVQRDAVNGINLALKNMLNQGDVTSEALQTIASDLQKVSNYGDLDTMQNVLRPLITSGVNSISVLDKVTQAIADTAAGTQKSTGEITQMLNKIATGSDESFTRFATLSGINIDIVKAKMLGLQTANERVSAGALLLGSKYAGMAKLMINPLKQLQNTIGDFQLELGRAFSPVITDLANTATAFLSNKDNVLSLVGTVKLLTVSLLALGAVKSIDMMGISAIATMKSFKNLTDTISKMNNIDYSFLARIVSTADEATDVVAEMKKAMHESYLATRVSATSWVSMGKAVFSAGLNLVSWISVAVMAVNAINMLGKSFGWWGKSIKDTTDKLELQRKKELERREVFKRSLQSAKDLLEINNRTVAENKELSRILDTLKSDYGIVVSLEEDRGEALKIINEELETQKSFNSIESTKKRMLEEKKALEQQIKSSEAIIDKYSDIEVYAQSTGDAIKGWFTGVSGIKSLTEQGAIIVANKKIIEDSVARIEELDKQINNLGKGNNNAVGANYKDISALSKYYEMVKFADSNYYEWKKNINNNLAKDYKDILKKAGYDEKEANDLSLKYARELNAKLLADKITYYESEAKARDKNRSIDDIKINAVETYDMSEYYAYLEKQLSATSAYYDVVGDADKTYYDYKKQLIEDDVNAQLAAGLLNDDQATLLRKKRMEDLLMETEAYKNHYAIVNAGIQGAMGSMLKFAKVTAKSNNDIAKAWYALADAVIAELKRMVSQMMVNFAWQKILGFMNFGASTSSGTLPLGTGGGIPMGGNFASVGMNPNTGIGTNIPQTPIINTNRSSDISIVDRLERLEKSIVDAINNNSLRKQIRTIDSVELAQEVDRGNNKRSFL